MVSVGNPGTDFAGPQGGKADGSPFMKRSPLLRYGVAVSAVAIALALKLLLDPLIEEESPFLLFLGAVTVGAWFGGLRAGLLATALAALVSDYYFLSSDYSLRVESFGQGLRLVLFVTEGAFVSVLTTEMRSARLRAETSALEAWSHREDLRRSEERFRSLVRNSSDIVMVLEADGTITYESPAVEQILGYKPEERVGANALDHIHPDDVEYVRGEFTEVVGRTGTRSLGEYRVCNKEGQWRHCESIANNLIRDPAIRGIVVNTRDITARKRAEEQWTSSHALLQSIVESTEDSIYVKDARGRYLMVNDSYARIIGRSVKEIIGKDDTQLFPPETARSLREADLRVLKSGQTVQVEERLPLGDSVRTLLSTKVASRDNRGEVAGVIGVSTDITRRKEAEEALKESEERYRAVVEQAAEGIHMSDLNTKRILESNVAFRNLLGYTSEELHQMTLYDFVAHDRESIDANLQRVLEQGSHSIGERQYRCKDGSLVDVEVNTSVISYAGRQVVCAVCHDVTERKRSDTRLRRSLNSLLALYEAGQILSSTLELEEVGTRLLQIMQRISGLTTAVISVPNEHGHLRVWRAVGLENLYRKARYTPAVQEVLAKALKTPEYQSFKLPGLGSDDDELVVLCLPLRVRDKTIGLLEIYGPGGMAEDGPGEILSSLATQAASALENGRLYGELGERERQLKELVGKLFAAQEEERRRIAYDVHDGLTQIAVAAYQHLQAFADDHPLRSAQARAQLELALELVQQTASEARRVIAGLRPMVLDDFGLATAIRSQVEALRGEGWHVRYEETLGQERLPMELETTLFRVSQEALTNVRKHAQTDQVNVVLQRLEGHLRLEVRDRGQGFQTTGAADRREPGEKIGLSSMQERVALLGGDFEIHSEPSTGTTIKVVVPLPTSEEDHEN
jgi:PAS domain S-box-containing protein